MILIREIDSEWWYNEYKQSLKKQCFVKDISGILQGRERQFFF